MIELNDLKLKNRDTKKVYLKPKDELVSSKSTSKNIKIFDLLFKAVGLWLLKDEDSMMFNGTEEEVRTLSNTMLATKDFYNYLKSDTEMDLNVMKSLLDRKNNCAMKFEKLFNVKWPF